MRALTVRSGGTFRKTQFNIEPTDQTKRTVIARDLWEFLESKQRFANWITNRIRKYGFVKGEDFIINLLQNNCRGRPTHEYHLTWDMAKELGMIENSDKGKKAIEYHANEAKKRQQATLPSKGQKGFNVPEPVPGHSKGESREKAGEAFGVSGRKDFWLNLTKTNGPGRPAHEYHLTMGMAKELSMIENNDQGKRDFTITLSKNNGHLRRQLRLNVIHRQAA